MLVYFKVGNFRSIKEPIVINFKAAAISEHKSTHVVTKENDELLRTVLLYGPNASGKSKILDGFVFYRWLVLTSATGNQSTDEINTEPFALNTRTMKQPSFFESEFYIGNKAYRYGFEADKKVIHKEWLLEVRKTTVQPLFLRHKQEFDISKKFANAAGLEKRTRKNALFLSVASQWNVQVAEAILEWFSEIITVHGLMDSDYRRVTTTMLKRKDLGPVVTNLIKKADLGINRLYTANFSPEDREAILRQLPEELRKDTLDRMDNELSPVFTGHTVYDHQGKAVDEAQFELNSDESEGTKKFYNLAGVFIDAIGSGRLVIIDEFDARLHTLLTKAIINLFNKSGVNKSAQLMAVSHDTALLDKDLLRRDQIYFIEKDRYGASQAATLVEFKARKEAPYYKNYLEGKYGAIPFIGNFESTIKDARENSQEKI